MKQQQKQKTEGREIKVENKKVSWTLNPSQGRQKEKHKYIVSQLVMGAKKQRWWEENQRGWGRDFT